VKATNTGAADVFGESVAVTGDSESEYTVVIGARGEASNATGVNGDQANNSAAASGAAYVVVGSGDLWSHLAYLKASNTGAGDNFGWSVSVSGDTAVVGAHTEDSNATGVDGDQANNSADGSGAAYVFLRDAAGNWSQLAYLKASNTDGGDRFGHAVSVSADIALIGAYNEDSLATGVNGNQADNSLGDPGAAYVITVPVCSCLGDMNGDDLKDGADLQQFVNCVILGGSCACADVDGANGITLDDVPAFVADLLDGSLCP
jgi:hypothetical protein